MNPLDTSSNTEGQQTNYIDPVFAESLSKPGFVRIKIIRPIIHLTWNNDDVDPLPIPIPFCEGTCEC
jgi:hypothetical protein